MTEYRRLWWFDTRDARRRRIRHFISTVDLDPTMLADDQGERCAARFVTSDRTGAATVWFDAAEPSADMGELLAHEWCHAALRGFGGEIPEEAIVEHMAPNLWAMLRGSGFVLPPRPEGLRALAIHAKALDRAKDEDE